MSRRTHQRHAQQEPHDDLEMPPVVLDLSVTGDEIVGQIASFLLARADQRFVHAKTVTGTMERLFQRALAHEIKKLAFAIDNATATTEGAPT